MESEGKSHPKKKTRCNDDDDDNDVDCGDTGDVLGEIMNKFLSNSHGIIYLFKRIMYSWHVKAYLWS